MCNPLLELKRLVLIGMIFPGILAVLIGSWSCHKDYSGKMETLTIATVPTEINALLYIAEAQDFFARNGLKVTIKEVYDSGATATTGMLNGEGDTYHGDRSLLYSGDGGLVAG